MLSNHSAQRLQYQENLNKLTLEYALLANFQINFRSIKTVNILSIGCGEDPVELEPLKNLFSKELNLEINYVGIDISEDDIKKNIKNNIGNTNVNFHVCDGNNMDAIRKFFKNESIHCVVTRHPVFMQVSPYKKHFEYMFASTIPALLAEGGILLTSLFEEEKVAFIKLVGATTDSSLSALPENKENLAHIEGFQTHFLNVDEVHHYADRFMFAVSDFKPNLAMQSAQTSTTLTILEQANKIAESFYTQTNFSSSHVEELFKLLLNELLNTDTMLDTNCMIKKLNEIKSENTVISLLIQTNIFSVSNTECMKYTLELTKLSGSKERFIEKLSDMIAKAIKLISDMKKDNIPQEEIKNAFYAACNLALLTPLRSDIFSKEANKQEQLSSSSSVFTSAPGYFGF